MAPRGDRGLKIKGGKQDYVILVMVMDRLSASAKADVRLAESEIGTKGHGGASKYLLDRGWRAGIVPGTFALDETKLVVKVVFQPGKEEGFFDRTEALVGLYSPGYAGQGGQRERLPVCDVTGRARPIRRRVEGARAHQRRPGAMPELDPLDCDGP